MGQLYSAVLTGFDQADKLVWSTGEITGTLEYLQQQLERALERKFLDMGEDITRIAFTGLARSPSQRKPCAIH